MEGTVFQEKRPSRAEQLARKRLGKGAKCQGRPSQRVPELHGTKCHGTTPQRVQKLHRRGTKCQGTTLVVPQAAEKRTGALAAEACFSGAFPKVLPFSAASKALLPVSLALLLAFSVPGFAQAASGAAMTGPYRIAGTVINAVTGEPVRGAQVALLTVEDSQMFASTESGEDGHFAIDHLPAAKFQLTVSKRGYCTWFYEEHDEYNTAIVTGEGQETGNLVFQLPPGAVLSGVVAGDGGDPVEGATVMLFEKPRGHDPDAKIEPAGTATTDDMGAYEFSGLTAGEYLLAVKAQPWYAINRTSSGPGVGSGQRQETESQASLDVAYPVTYFDSTTEEGSATPIVLTGGSRQDANISLHAVPALHLEVNTPGNLEGKNAHPKLRQSIFGVETGTGGEDVQYDGRTGKTEFTGVAPGHYELTQGDPPRVAALDATASQQVDPDAGAPTVSVNGSVRMVSGAVPSGATVLSLEPVDGAEGEEISQPLANRKTFSFDAVPPGIWALQVEESKGETMPVLSVTLGAHAQAGNRITVQDRPLSLVVTVSAHAARIEGFARRDGKGVSAAMVVLVPKTSASARSLTADLARRDQSDSDGSFALLNVAPGEYTVVAIEDGWELDWANPAVIGRYLPGGQTVTVRDGAEIEPGRRIVLSEPVTVQAR